jgi:hypothetical protein
MFAKSEEMVPDVKIKITRNIIRKISPTLSSFFTISKMTNNNNTNNITPIIEIRFKISPLSYYFTILLNKAFEKFHFSKHSNF